MSDSLQPHVLQHARLPCPSLTPGACSNSRPSSQWCHPTIPFSVSPFSSCLQSFPASGSFPMGQFFASGGQSIGVLASASVLPTNMLICSKYWNGEVWVILCSFSELFWLFSSHKTPYDFYNYLVSFFKGASRDFDRFFVESVDQFGEFCLFTNVKSTNPQTRDWTHVPCIGRRILNHWTTREVPSFAFFC